MSVLTATTFMSYFIPVYDLYADLATWQASGLVVFWVFLFALCTYGNAGWLREKMCIYMCPYSRFQSVMFDKDTLLVTYDNERGENRGPRKRKEDPKKQKTLATVSTVIYVLKSALRVSIFVMVCNMNALTVAYVLMLVTKPWKNLAMKKTSLNTPVKIIWLVNLPTLGA